MAESGLTRFWNHLKAYVSDALSKYDELAVATTQVKGQVRPDGVTITVDEDGTIHGAMQVDVPTKLSELENDAGYLVGESLPTKLSELTDDVGYLTAESDPTVPSWAKQPNKPTYTASEVGALSSSTVIPSKVSQLSNDSGYLTTETDPTVPSWAKQPSKPSYTAAEVGALPSSAVIPTKTSQLTNDSGYIKTVDASISSTSANPVQNKAVYTALSAKLNSSAIYSWAKASTKPKYTASEVGALPSSTVVPKRTSQLTNDSGYITRYDYAERWNPGTVRPDNVTTFVDGGVISAKDWGAEVGAMRSTIDDLADEVARLRRQVRNLDGRLAALEPEGEGAAYDDGTIESGWTLEDGTLVTNASYDDGTIG